MDELVTVAPARPQLALGDDQIDFPPRPHERFGVFGCAIAVELIDPDPEQYLSEDVLTLLTGVEQHDFHPGEIHPDGAGQVDLLHQSSSTSPDSR